MTCIIGLAHKGKVYLGGDSGCSVDGTLYELSAGKVFRIGEFLMGSSGTGRFNNIVRHTLKPPPARGRLDRYMATEFADALRHCLKEAGYMTVKESVEQSDNDDLIVGARGAIFYCDAFFSVTMVRGGLWATGSGGDIALGAMDATPSLAPRQRIRRALLIAERRSEGVTRPFSIISA